MKQILVVICSIVMATSAFADADICRKRNTFVALLSKSTDGQSMTSSSANKTWSVTFNYTTMSVSTRSSQTVSGVAACNSVSGTANTANTALYTSTSDEGVHCWCEMWSPVHSYWTYTQSYASNAACASSCAANCANLVKTSTAFRTGIYGAIW